MTTVVPTGPLVAMGTYNDWLVAWKEWARTRKRGKMAQFIVDKLEENVREGGRNGGAMQTIDPYYFVLVHVLVIAPHFWSRPGSIIMPGAHTGWVARFVSWYVTVWSVWSVGQIPFQFCACII